VGVAQKCKHPNEIIETNDVIHTKANANHMILLL